MITVMGATGNIGGRISELLLTAGQRVRALGRSVEKLAPLKELGAEVLTGDAQDATFLTTAFRGTDAAFTLLPPDLHAMDFRRQQDQQGEAIAAAIRDSGVRVVVFLSSLGAELSTGTGPIAGLHAQEQRLRRLKNVNILILRPTYFFENFLSTVGLIKHQGINGGAAGPDVSMPMIATRDIAEVAAEALRRRDWSGVVVRELLGPRDLSFAEATRIIGERIGQPDLPYVQFPYEAFAASLVQMGISESVAGLYAEMSRAMNEGKVQSLEGRRAENSTPTRFEDFVTSSIVPAYEKA
ncbi:MAG TPA: NmrA family NAD(P)-binding protein [Vicinamibacterales bacterium]|nr:NmrA family NAD(P)-binding protein [Vicinamibacterales bacterium]